MKTKIGNGGSSALTTLGGSQGQRARKMLLFATLITLALTFVPYSNYLLYPLRLFVTFIHESGHALAAVGTGGSVDFVQVFPNGEGLTQTRQSPLLAWVTLSGGYLGTTLFGALMLHFGRLRKLKAPGRAVLYGLAAFVLTITALWGFRPFYDPFTLGVGLTLAAGLFAMGRFLTMQAAEFLAAFLAVQCSLNALGDLRILLTLTAQGSNHNDAAFMAQHFGMTPMFWAALWALTATGILFVSLRGYLRATAK